MPGETELRLYRDSLNTPWGFRLQGGKDLGAPLTIQRVSAGTPSDGELQSGDVVLQIQGSDAARFTHLQAQEQVRKAGGSLLLRVLRYGGYAPPSRAAYTPVHVPQQRVTSYPKPGSQDVGIDYAARGSARAIPVAPQVAPQPGFMLSRVKDTLAGASGGGYSADPYYPTYERNVTPTRLAQPPSYQPPTYAAPPPALEAEAPAWAGSLRSSAKSLESDKHIGPYPHAPRVQTVHYAPGESPQYGQHNPTVRHDTDTVRAAHLQYNSPLGLYSRSSAQEALQAQLHGKPGEGTIQILSESEVPGQQHASAADIGQSDF